MEKKISYNKALEEIESIIDSLSDNSIDVDKLTIQVKRATELIKLCRERLQKIETDVNEILKDEADEMSPSE